MKMMQLTTIKQNVLEVEMQTREWVKPLAAVVVLLLIGLAPSRPATAAGRVLQRLDVEETGDGALIHVRFNLPLLYVTHAPRREGDELSISLKVQHTDATGSLPEREALPYKASRRIPLTEVRFRNPGSPVVTLFFNHRVRYEVRGTPDFRGLEIRLIGEPVTATAPGPTTEAATSGASSRQQTIDTSLPYVINLASTLEQALQGRIPDLPLFHRYRLYLADHVENGKTWHRLRLGFFATREEAEALLPQLKEQFPEAWVTEAPAGERERSADLVINLIGRTAEEVAEIPVSELRTPDGKPVQPGSREERLARLMEEARRATALGNYSRAIQIYTKVSEPPPNPWSRQALEFLGLAREKKGQLAQARLVYERFLKEYPEGEDAKRVQQRLSALLTAGESKPRKVLRKAKRTEVAAREIEYEVFGGWSQFYRREASNTDEQGFALSDTALVSDLDVTGRIRKDQYELDARFTGGYTLNFLNNGTPPENRISDAYLEFLETEADHSLRLGRQSHSSDGVLGRFDGVLAGYRVNPVLRLKAVAGMPVASTVETGPDWDRYFYGVSADIGQLAQAWDFNLFFIEQRADGVLDRRAVGGEARYFRPGVSIFTLIDYDISYDKLNTFLMLGNFSIDRTRTTINLTLDYRTSPLLTTSNAIQGQGVSNLGNLLNSFTEEQARQLALDRTAETSTATLGLTQQLSDKFQLTADITATGTTGTPASGGVDEVLANRTDFFYSTQLIGSSLFKPGDVSIVGLRFSDASTANTLTFTFNTRYPVTRDFRVNPRLRFDHRKNNGFTEQYTFRPELRLDYRLRRWLQFEVDLGGEWLWQEQDAADSTKTVSYFANLGYRMEF